MAQKILLINPWIYDFAAYDLWAKPWGLLKISSILKDAGKDVYFLDTLDRRHPLLTVRTKDRTDGTGKYASEEVPKPEALKRIPRRFKRYGLGMDSFKKALPEEKIDVVLVSSGMTYWYPGAFEAVRQAKERYPGAAVVLGGTYATLCYEHAVKNSGADHVIRGEESGKLSALLGGNIDLSFRNILDADADHDWYDEPSYGVVRLSLGCPFDCAYCAQKKLGPDLMVKDTEKAVRELGLLYAKGIRKFAFYDDALLFDTAHFRSYLTTLAGKGLRVSFYTPNGLHARFLDRETALLMKRSGFENPVLSLEFFHDVTGRKWHTKITRDELETAVGALKKAGYGPGEFTVYLMLGAPAAGLDEVLDGIEFVHELGGKISLSEFSPVPGTRLAEEIKIDLEEPLMQNNSIYPFIGGDWEEVMRVKHRASYLNSLFDRR
jgi:radical SAM superfamily enzyme YgiQ (UPF0313 family)